MAVDGAMLAEERGGVAGEDEGENGKSGKRAFDRAVVEESEVVVVNTSASEGVGVGEGEEEEEEEVDETSVGEAVGGEDEDIGGEDVDIGESVEGEVVSGLSGSERSLEEERAKQSAKKKKGMDRTKRETRTPPGGERAHGRAKAVWMVSGGAEG